jgi:hypothetical protein
MESRLFAVMRGAVVAASLLIALGLARKGRVPPVAAGLEPLAEAAPAAVSAVVPPIVVPLPTEAEAPQAEAPRVAIAKAERRGRARQHRRWARERGLSPALTLNPF